MRACDVIDEKLWLQFVVGGIHKVKQTHHTVKRMIYGIE